MGLVYDPELYRASEKHFAPYPIPAHYQDAFQTWHTDMVFDNGYYATVMFTFMGPLRVVMLQIVDDTGEIAVESVQIFPEEECHFETEGYDINIADNYFRANFPSLVVHVSDENIGAGADILVESLVMPTISELPDGIGIGRMNTPNMPVSIAWFFMPWNRLTGTLKVDGKEIPVSGYGWSDHQFGTDDFFSKACHYFYWANFPLGEHTLTLFEAQGAAAQGFRNFKWLWDFKGDKLYSYDRNADFYIFATDIEQGDTVPKKLTYVFEDSRIRGKVTCTWKTLIQKQPVDAVPFKVMLNRSAYDCHAELTIDGEKIDKTFVRILEAAYTLDPEPDKSAAQKDFPAAQAIVTTSATSASESAAEVEPVDKNAPCRLSVKSKLKAVLSDPEGNAVLEKYVPGISNDPNTKLGYGMTLKMLFSIPKTGVSKEMLAQIDSELRKIK